MAPHISPLQVSYGVFIVRIFKKINPIITALHCLPDMSHYGELTLKRREMHECRLSAVATDALVLKHQAIRIHSVD